MGRFLFNLLKIILILAVFALIGLAIYVLLFDPTSPVNEISTEITLSK